MFRDDCRRRARFSSPFRARFHFTASDADEEARDTFVYDDDYDVSAPPPGSRHEKGDNDDLKCRNGHIIFMKIFHRSLPMKEVWRRRPARCSAYRPISAGHSRFQCVRALARSYVDGTRLRYKNLFASVALAASCMPPH